jgi:7-cyano-7-deazaguanine synthase
MIKTVAIVSGGMDSIALVHHLVDQGHVVDVISFDYGQRHRKELNFAEDCANRLNLAWHLVDLSNLTDLLATSALTNSVMEVPDGHYAEDTMRITVVPNRNAIMLNIAAGLAVSIGAKHIATGVHAGDHYIYPDCRPQFIDATERMLKIANEGFINPDFSMLAPFVNSTKADIARLGDRLNVPWESTWSCYKGNEIHCGACGTCFERREAFAEAGINDPTIYSSTPDYVDPRK